MNPKFIQIAVCEPSVLINKGLVAMLDSMRQNIHLYHTANLDELKNLFLKKTIDLVIINPQILLNQLKNFQLIKKNAGDARWIGLIYNLFDQEILALFDDFIFINDTNEKVISCIKNNLIPTTIQSEFLTERETEVLKLLVGGKSNKEIADVLNISIHTVMTHRKNISQKTGIKSVSGLTIYAVINHLITLDQKTF